MLKESHDDHNEFALEQTRTLKEIDNKEGGAHAAGISNPKERAMFMAQMDT